MSRLLKCPDFQGQFIGKSAVWDLIQVSGLCRCPCFQVFSLTSSTVLTILANVILLLCQCGEYAYHNTGPQGTFMCYCTIGC